MEAVMQTSIIACISAVTLGMTIAGGVHAQPPAAAARPETLKRTLLQTFDVPDSAYKTVIGLSELGPNQSSGRQSHPGPEGGYVLEGGGTIVVDGQPPLQLKPGQSYKLAPGAVHDVRSGPDGTKLLVTWVVRKDKPLSSPAD
jgi:quercetin dioxygenase-like cupin family protein